MIICQKCGKENEDRYKFCLGCGAQLSAPPPAAVPPKGTPPPPGAARPAPAQPAGRRPSPTPPAGHPEVQPGSIRAMPPTEPEELPAASSPAPAPREGSRAADKAAGLAAGAANPRPVTASRGGSGSGARPAPSSAPCPECGTPNPPEFVFCGSCGTRLKSSGQSTMSIREAKAAPAAPAKPRGRMALIRPDGTEGGSVTLDSQENVIGRGSGPLFDGDSYLSPRHARLRFEDRELVLEDAGSLNGVFVKITKEEPLKGGDVFRIGQELLRFDEITAPQPLDDGTELMGSPNPGYRGRLSIIVGPGVDGSAFPLMGEEIVLGRERGDILFSDDGYVSGTHAKIVLSDERPYLVDLGSSNGTFIKLTEPRKMASGTFVLIGQQLFRIDYKA